MKYWNSENCIKCMKNEDFSSLSLSAVSYVSFKDRNIVHENLTTDEAIFVVLSI